MDVLIETTNHWGGRLLTFAWPMLWQSSILIAILFTLDLALRRKIRPAVRYALWLVLLVKLLLPPTLALPTSLAWWVRPSVSPPSVTARTTTFVVTYGDVSPAEFPTPVPPVVVPPRKPSLSGAGRTVAMWAVTAVGLLAWLVARWRKVAGDVSRAMAAPAPMNEMWGEAQRCIKLPRHVRLLVTNHAMSPAVCGLFRPVILLPESLVERLTPSQVRAVLLHELVHLRRGDVWVNCVQALLQIVYWWHPLLWLANARIRRSREEAVDDAVMLALADDADSYAPTLLEVAKLSFKRPLANLGLVGILESRSALRQRVERLIDFRPPRKAGLTIASCVCVITFTALAVPMGERPPSIARETPPAKPGAITAGITELSTNDGGTAGEALVTRTLKFDPEVFLPNLRQRMGLPEKSTDGEITEALPGLLAGLGLEMQPHGSLIIKERGLTLFRAPQAKIEAIERLFTELNNGRPQSEIPAPGRPPDQETIIWKLNQIRFDSPAYDQRPLIEVIRDLSWETKNHDPEKKGLSFHIKYSASVGKMVDLSAVKVTIPAFSNARLTDLLEAVLKGADKSINYLIGAGLLFYSAEDESVLPLGMTMAGTSGVRKGRESLAGSTALDAFLPKSKTNVLLENPNQPPIYGVTWPASERLYTRTFKLDTKAFYQALHEQGYLASVPLEPGDIDTMMSFQAGTNYMLEVSRAMRRFFSHLGVDLSPGSGKSLYWKDRLGIVMVRSTKEDLDTLEKALPLLSHTQPETALDTSIASLGDNVPVLGDLPGAGKLFRSESNPTETTAASDRSSLESALKILYEQTPGSRIGVSLFFQVEVREDGSYGAHGKRMDLQELRDWLSNIKQTAPDAILGFQVHSNAPSESVNAVTRLRDELGMTPGSAPAPSSSPVTQPLFTRTFKLDPNTLLANLRQQTGLSSNAPIAELSRALKDFFAKLGIELQPPQTVYYNHRNGMLLARATPPQLDVIEQAIQTLNYVPPQIHIKVRFVELSREEARKTGFDWDFSRMLAAAGAVATWTVKGPSDFYGILTDPQFKAVLKILEQHKGVDILAGPEVTTLSGRQAQIQTVEIKTVVNGINLKALIPPGVIAAESFTNSLYQTQALPFGPVLDVIPTVSADGYTINMTAIPTVTEFLGYDVSANFMPAYVNGQRTNVALPLPRFRVRQMTVSAAVRDGQTLVLSNPMVTEISKKPDGSTETKDITDKERNHLIIFVTPTLIDPAGNRIHQDDEPSAKRK